MRIKEGETVAAVSVTLTLKMHFLIEQRVFIVKEYVQSKSIQSVHDIFFLKRAGFSCATLHYGLS